MKLVTQPLAVATHGPGFFDITPDVARFVVAQPAREAQLTLFVRHTSASLVIQENADPDVLADLQAFMDRIAPWDAKLYAHNTEGPDDMPAHIRSALTQTSLTVPVVGGTMLLGRWQAIYLWEHRDGEHQREVVMQVLG